MRLFAIGFTKRQNQLKKTCYASAAQQKRPQEDARDHAGEIIATHHTTAPLTLPPRSPTHPLPLPSAARASTATLNELVNKFIPEVIGKEIEKACHGFYPSRTATSAR